MAKKKAAAADKYKEILMGATSQFIGRELHNLTAWLTGITHFGKHMRKLATAYALVISGLTIVFYGIARLIMTFAPDLQDWIAYVVVGVVAIVFGYLYRKI